MFNVPSTPDSRRGGNNDIPSTTPAGPPPTDDTRQSFDPSGRLPPVSALDSPLGASDAKSPFSFSAFVKSPATQQYNGNGFSAGFTVPHSSSPGMNLPEGLNQRQDDTAAFFQSHAFTTAQPPLPPLESIEDDLDFENPPRGAKRSRNGDVMGQSMLSSRMHSRVRDRDPTMPGLVDRLVAGMPAPEALQADDDQILDTEFILIRLDEASQSERKTRDEELEAALVRSVQGLQQIWSESTPKQSIPASIGPVDKSPFVKAVYIASLLFQIHHPIDASAAATRNGQNKRGLALQRPDEPARLLPKALLDWLNTYHMPFPEDLLEVQSARPSSTAHDRFWDTVFQTLLRGNFEAVVALLSKANWTHAETALEDGYDSAGYRGQQLEAVKYVVGQCVQLLQTCPAVTDHDWQVSGSDWALFRSRARKALDELGRYAESDGADREYGDVNVFAASRTSFAAGSRRAESRVPWTIYEQLKAVYGQLLGYREEILLSAQDWLEATMYLAVWWDGEDEGQFGASRRGAPTRARERLVDVDAIAAYKQRLVSSFASVTDEPEDPVLSVNALYPVQIALGAALEGEVESVLKLLQRWSPLVAAAVVDVASIGGWMTDGSSAIDGLLKDFDQDDLMVLNHGQTGKSQNVDRDSILITYSDLLLKKELLRSSDGEEQQGWEMAVRVLSRLDSPSAAQEKIKGLFGGISLTTPQQVDKALSLCGDLGLAEQIKSISERYADSLASTSQSYGHALLYYARAHSATQLQTTLDKLLSSSLVRSAAYPPAADLDSQLADLLTNQTGLLSRLARMDSSAAKLLATKSSGYATLRRFYDLRDENDDSDAASNPGTFRSGLRPAARKKEMAKAIVALVESASESIRGGLYDGVSSGVVQVDTLLTLLGETLPLLDQSGVFGRAQLMALLGATEDLETISAPVSERAEAQFKSCMAEYHGAGQGRDQSSSGLLGKSGYGMVNSRGSMESEGRGAAGDGRAWDWRKGIALTFGKAAEGKDVLRLLRVGVATELGRGWIEGAADGSWA